MLFLCVHNLQWECKFWFLNIEVYSMLVFFVHFQENKFDAFLKEVFKIAAENYQNKVFQSTVAYKMTA